MRLLLLPVALGTFPLWLSYSAYLSPARRRVLGGAVVAFVVFVLVGYVAPLVWTGFRGQTLWDWLTLLVLPLAFISVQAWPASGREIRRHHVVLVIAVLVAWGVTMIGGYAAGWTWTGYAGNTLWDWVSLLLAPIAITIVGVPLARRLSGDVAAIAEAEAERQDRDRALREARSRRVG
jgi:peptidoglycan/LPS O-acetylase OafA/YrhL